MAVITPRVLYSLCADHCVICERKTFNLNFLDEHDDLIAVFRKVLDVCMKELSKGSGTKVRQVDSIMPEDEEKIWTRGVFGLDSSQELKYTDIRSKDN